MRASGIGGRKSLARVGQKKEVAQLKSLTLTSLPFTISCGFFLPLTSFMENE